METQLIKNFKDITEVETYLKSRIEAFQDFPHPPVNFKDISTILYYPELYQTASHYLKELLPKDKQGNFMFNKIICLDARGFLFGLTLASAASVPLIMARKKDKLPGKKITQKFKKEYKADGGKEFEIIQIRAGLIGPGDRVLIHDDLFATGGTANAVARLVLKCGAEIAGFHFVMELPFLSGRKLIQKHVSNDRIVSLVKY